MWSTKYVYRPLFRRLSWETHEAFVSPGANRSPVQPFLKIVVKVTPGVALD